MNCKINNFLNKFVHYFSNLIITEHIQQISIYMDNDSYICYNIVSTGDKKTFYIIILSKFETVLTQTSSHQGSNS